MQLHALEFSEVEFVEDKDEANRQQSDEDDPVPSLRHSLRSLLPDCSVCFSRCTLTINRD